MIGTAANPPSGGNEMDVTRLTEEEQIALAIQMSMTQADNASKSSRFSMFLNPFRSFSDATDVDMKEAPAASTESSATSKPSKVILFTPFKYLQHLFSRSQRKKLSKQMIHSLPHSMILNFYAMFSVIYLVST